MPEKMRVEVTPDQEVTALIYLPRVFSGMAPVPIKEAVS